MTLFIKLTDVRPDQKPVVLKNNVIGGGEESYAVDASLFRAVPCSPFPYWAPGKILQLFEAFPPVEIPGRHAAAGASTKDNARFLRIYWEISVDKRQHAGHTLDCLTAWVPLAKGGSHKRFYSDVYLVVQWGADGKELKCAAGAWRESKGWGNHWRAELHNSEYYGRPGITWPVRSQKGFSARALGSGGIFGHKGPTIFLQDDEPSDLGGMLAITNSSVFSYLVSLQMAFGAYEVGVIQRTPVPSKVDGRLPKLADVIWTAERRLDSIRETSHAFLLPAELLRNIQPAAEDKEEIILNQAYREIDTIVFEAYGIETSERRVIEDWFNRRTDSEDGDNFEEDGLGSNDEDEVLAVGDDANAFVSWAFGVAFGRFDVRLATGERTIPPEPKPFDQLPTRSPGMLPDGAAPFMPTNGIFVDDLGHPDDLATRLIAVYEHVGVAPPEPNDFRRTLARDFFPGHVRMYSKSRRKAPIYWQLATPSASFAVWLYIHAFSKDTLFRVQDDYVARKLVHERRQLEGLRAEAGPSPTTNQSRAIEAQTVFVEELSALLDEVKRVAPLWDPNLDDGVILNFAPLWRLVPQNPAWQKELRVAWAALVAGDFDWAHLSMRFWPERVVPKCVKDRSMAIAHGLEDEFWFEDEDGKWKARPAPSRPIEILIAERTSPAVRAALASLVEAPEITAGVGRWARKPK